MKHAIARTLIAILLVPVLSRAADTITGKWTGLTPNGADVTLDLIATETTLKGTLTRGENVIPLAEGKVLKNSFTFRATFNEQTETFTGEVAGDDMKVWMDRQGREMSAVLKRVKK